MITEYICGVDFCDRCGDCMSCYGEKCHEADWKPCICDVKKRNRYLLAKYWYGRTPEQAMKAIRQCDESHSPGQCELCGDDADMSEDWSTHEGYSGVSTKQQPGEMDR